MATETIADILREIREGMPQKMEGFKNGEFVVLNTAKLADQIEEAAKREVGSCKDTIKLWCDRADELRRKCDEQYAELKRYKLADKTVTDCNQSKLREDDKWLNQLVNLINGEINHYMSQGADCFSVDCGPWHIRYDKEEGGAK